MDIVKKEEVEEFMATMYANYQDAHNQVAGLIL